MKCLFVDHKDSFSHNVINFLKMDPYSIEVDRCNYDETHLCNVEGYDFIVLGPGPFAPKEVSQSVKFVQEQLHKIPMLGICLGMQVMNVATGGHVVRSVSPHHGSAKDVYWLGLAEFLGVTKLGSYNSLTNVDISKDWDILAKDSSEEVQAIVTCKHKVKSIGVQFHPDSFLSGEPMKIKKFLIKELTT